MQITVDAKEAEQQMLEIANLCRARYPNGAPGDVLEAVAAIATDTVISDGGSTVGADGELQLIKRLRFGKSCDVLRDLLRGVAPNN